MAGPRCSGRTSSRRTRTRTSSPPGSPSTIATRCCRRARRWRTARQKSGARIFGSPDERVLWMKGIWERLPLYVRPCLYFFYRYVVRLGFLDGRQGFVFHVLQGFWYRLLVDINLEELRRANEKTPGLTR